MTELEIYRPVPSTRGNTRMIILTISILLFIICLFLTVRSFSLSIKDEKKVTINTFNQLATFSSSAEVRPSILYPQGGDIGSRDVYLTKIINNLKIKVKIQVNAEKPISVSGKTKVFLKLVADNFWERDFPLLAEESFEAKDATSFTALDGTYAVDINTILSFIEQVEKETQTLVSGYTLLVKPVFSAKSMDKNNFLFDYSPEYSIKLSKSLISPESQARQEKSGIIEAMQVTNGTLNLVGFSIPVLHARYLFPILSIIFLGAATYFWRVSMKNKKEGKVSEQEKINRDYKNRIIFTSDNLNLDNQIILIKTKSFKELLKVADEQEKLVLCHSDSIENNFRCTYYVIDGSVVYTYKAFNR